MYVCIICCLSVCPDTLSMMTYYIPNMQSKNDQLPELSLTLKKNHFINKHDYIKFIHFYNKGNVGTVLIYPKLSYSTRFIKHGILPRNRSIKNL